MARQKRAATPTTPPKQSTDKPVPTPVMQTRARITRHLDDAVAACEGLFEEHGQSCECEPCRMASNIVGAIRVFSMLMSIT
jgi:hypothetical protein